MLLFGSRHWFLALFSLANQSSTKDLRFHLGEKKRIKKLNQTTKSVSS